MALGPSLQQGIVDVGEPLLLVQRELPVNSAADDERGVVLLAQAFKPRRNVDGVADGRVVAARGASYIADDCAAEMDTDADFFETRKPLRRKTGQPKAVIPA